MGKVEVNLDYIRGFADGEGCVYFQVKGNALDKVIKISNTDHKLIEKVSSVLNKMNIGHTIVRRKEKNYKICWSIYIKTYEAIERYNKLIGFCSSDKQRKLERIIKFGKEKGYKKLERIELIPEIWRLRNKKLSQREIASKLGVNKIFINRVINKRCYKNNKRLK